MQREARLPKQPCVSMQIYFFLYLSFHITIHSTLFRDNIDESLLYSSDEEDPYFLMSPLTAKENVTVDQRLLADPLSSLEAGGGVVLGASAMIRDGKLPFSRHQRSIGPQKKSTPVSWAAPSLKSADTCSKDRPQLSKQH